MAQHAQAQRVPARRPPPSRAPWARRLWAVAALAALAGALALRGAAAQAQTPESGGLPTEYTVKAVFLYNFGRYVEWPEASLAGAPGLFVIGIVGEDAFGGALDEIAAKKTIQGHRIVVRRFASPDEYRPPCHILFASRSLTADQHAAVIAKTGGTGVLVVGETPGFAQQGATANFFIDEGRVRFEINGDAVRRAQLHMDAKLLSLGRPVSR